MEVNASSNLSLRAVVNFRDSTDAEAAKKAGEGLLEMGGMAGQMPPEVKKLIDAVKFSNSGSQLVVTASVATRRLYNRAATSPRHECVRHDG